MRTLENLVASAASLEARKDAGLLSSTAEMLWRCDLLDDLPKALLARGARGLTDERNAIEQAAREDMVGHHWGSCRVRAVAWLRDAPGRLTA